MQHRHLLACKGVHATYMAQLEPLSTMVLFDILFEVECQ